MEEKKPMKVKKKDIVKQFVALVLAFFMALSVLADADTVKAERAESTATEQEDTEAEIPDAGTVNTVSYEGEGYAVTCNIINSWGEGYMAEVSIKNTSDKKIHNWNLMFALDGEITDIWNAKISSRNEDGLYTVEGESYNSNISPDSAVSFGFNASGSQETPEFHFSQSVQMPVEEGDFEVDYAVSDDWETGFVGEIGILNKSSKSFKDWCITFDWDNDIDGIWNAKIVSHEENHYVISCEEYNRIIEAGQRVQFGFSCPSGKSSTRPENIAVTHFTDGDGKEEDNGDAEDEIEPSEVTEYVDIEYQNGNCAQSVLDDVRFVNYSPELLDVAWVSSDESVVTNDGNVTRGEEDRTMTVTAEIQYKGKDYRKEFTLTVKRKTDIDVEALQDYSLSQLEQMNSGDEYYKADVNDYRYLEHVYGRFSEIKVDSYETALVSLYNIKSAMGIDNPLEELQVNSVYTGSIGYVFKFNQMYKGIEVLSNQVTVAADKNGNVYYFGSSYFPLSNEVGAIPRVSLEEAVHNAALCGYVQMEEEEENQQKLTVLNEYGKGTLVWRLFCEKQDEPWEVYEVLVDALTAEALFAYKTSCNLTGKDLNNISREFSVEKLNKGNRTQYRLKDTKRNIEIYNPNNKNPITKNENKWNKKEVSAMANMEEVYDYFLDKFKRKSYDNRGGTIKICFDSTLHNNAKWRGTYMLIGEGTNVKYKPQSLAAGKDVMAHEYSHGIVQNQTKLIYDFGTIGTISEAYADIFACYADGNWKIGEDVVKKGCLRDVATPEKSKCATRVSADDKYYVDDSNFDNDNGGIHKNSTVISHVAYRMAGSRYSVSSKQIWYDSLCLGYETYSDLLVHHCINS